MTDVAVETFDIVVIGAGPGGYPAAIRAAQLGASVAIVEKERLGGTCLNWGCIPTKALIGGAEVLAQVKHAARHGLVKGADVVADYPAMIAHKDAVVDKLRSGVGYLLKANGVRVFEGAASFKDRHTVSVGNSTRLNAKTFIIATGSTSLVPGSLPKSDRVVESRAFLERRELPASMIVLGGGIIGCELACMAAVLGVEVTIVELQDNVLLSLDADVRGVVRNYMERELGIRVLTGSALENISDGPGEIRGEASGKAVSAEILLCATGRGPVTDGLNLAAAGVSISAHGFVGTDPFACTNVAGIYAIGDVTGRIQLAHYATSQGITAAENACGLGRSRIETLVPNVVFTKPEVGAVGLGEDEAKAQDRDVRIAKFSFRQLGRAMAVEETTGFVKLISDAATDQLLGAAVVGAHATELISQATVAIRAELTALELGRTIHAHPTFGEAWMEAAHTIHGQAIHVPPSRI